jgi:hypothetical protein
MRTKQFLAMLRRRDLPPNGRRTAAALGLSLRQLQRISAGQAPVPRPVALLLIAYAKYGVPNPLWNPDRNVEDAITAAARNFGLGSLSKP